MELLSDCVDMCLLNYLLTYLLTAEWLAVEGVPWSAAADQQSFSSQGIIHYVTGFTLLLCSFLAHSIGMSLCNREASVVRLSVCKLFCANRYFYHKHDSIATKLAHDGPQMGLHPGCAQGQGQGQRSRDTGTSVMSRNVCYTVRSHVLFLHALTL